MYQANLIDFWNPSVEDCEHMQGLMLKYMDLPMDLADASLVAAAEATGLRTLFTLDMHFQIYQLADGSFLNMIC